MAAAMSLKQATNLVKSFPKMKRCYRCHQFKDPQEFGKDRHARDGLRNKCKTCVSEFYQQNKHKYREQQRKYYLTTYKNISLENSRRRRQNPEVKEKEREKGRAWLQVEENRQKKKEYRNRPEIKERSKKYHAELYINNRESILALQKIYQSQPDAKQMSLARHKDRVKRDVNYRLGCALRQRLGIAIRKNYKAGSAVDDLGCSIAELKIHLESKFQPTMTWDNYGKTEDSWSIDHIIPLSRFNLSDRQHFILANYYLNLQPMWHLENISKGNREIKIVVVSS